MAQRTVLLIDYEPRSIEDTKRPLLEAGFHVEVAHDGVAGLEAFRRLHPDLVLVEAMLPKKHGFDVCQEIKRSQEGKDVPVVITTGVYRGRKYRNQALQNFGCDEYLEKPFTDDALLAACTRFIQATIEEIEEQVVEAESVAEAAAALDLESMSEDEISSRLDSLLADFGNAVDEAATGDAPAPAAAAPSIPDAAAAGPASAVFAAAPATDGEAATAVPEAGAAKPSEAIEDLMPTIPVARPAAPAADDHPAVETRRHERVAEPTSEVARGKNGKKKIDRASAKAPTRSAETAMARPVTKSTVLESRRATPAGRPRWILPAAVVAAVAVVAALAWTFLSGGNGPGATVELPISTPGTFDAATVVAQTPLAVDLAAGAAIETPASVDPAQSPPVAAPASGETAPASRAEDAATASPPVEAAAKPAPMEAVEKTPAAKPVALETADGSLARVAEKPAAVPAVERAPAEAVKMPAPSGPTKAEPEAVAESAPSSSTQPASPEIEAAPAVPAAGTNSAAAPPSGAAATSSPATADAAPANATPGPAFPEPARAATPERVRRGPAPIAPEPPAVRRGDLLAVTDVDVEPVAVEKPAPRYDPIARRAKQEGDVVLNVLVDENGGVADVQVLRGVLGSTLDDAAVRAVRDWKYRPATKDGVPVKVWTMEIISFRL